MHFHTGETVEVKSLVVNHHYSGRWPSAAVVVGSWHEDGGLFGDSGPTVAGCVFSWPPTRWSEPVLELIRLVRLPSADIRLSGLVSDTVRYIKSRGVCDLLVSFADSTVGHHGGIYQACSWNYGGQRAPAMDGVVVNGQFVAGRMAYDLWGTRSPRLLAERGIDAEGHFDTGKHLYWKPLTKNGRRKADRLGLESLPYPRPAAAPEPQIPEVPGQMALL